MSVSRGNIENRAIFFCGWVDCTEHWDGGTLRCLVSVVDDCVLLCVNLIED